VMHPDWRAVGDRDRPFDPATLGPLTTGAEVQSKVERHTEGGKLPRDAQGNAFKIGDVSPKSALWALEPEARGHISGDLGVDPATGIVRQRGSQAPTGRADTEARYQTKKPDKPPTAVAKPDVLKAPDPETEQRWDDVLPKAEPHEWQALFDKQPPG